MAPADLAASLRAAARRYGTPLFVTDAAALEAAADAARAAFPDPWLRAYSLKANDLPAIVARIAGRGFGANVVSRGEWALARRAGLPNAAITLEGVGKSDADLRAVARAAAAGEPLRWIAIESSDEASVLARFVRAEGRPQVRVDALIRLNPGVEPDTQAGLATGARAAKFGVAADEVSSVIEAGGGPSGPIRWRGLHIHVGSQLATLDAWRDAVRRALALLALLRGGLPDFDTLDVGGGMPVAPWRPAGADGDAPPDRSVPGPERFAAECAALLEALPADRRPRQLAVEPGRLLVASAGWLVARVLHVRQRTLPAAPERSSGHSLAVLPPGSTTEERTRRLVVIDAGMTELLRPALYGAEHAVIALTSQGRPLRPGVPLKPTTVDGPVCESTDRLGAHLLPPLRRGDLVAIADAGAYCASMRSSYNGRRRPAEVVIEADGSLALARRRGTFASLG
jgi:diaminopimelate decarboxylase